MPASARGRSGRRSRRLAAPPRGSPCRRSWATAQYHSPFIGPCMARQSACSYASTQRRISDWTLPLYFQEPLRILAAHACFPQLAARHALVLAVQLSSISAQSNGQVLMRTPSGGALCCLIKCLQLSRHSKICPASAQSASQSGTRVSGQPSGAKQEGPLPGTPAAQRSAATRPRPAARTLRSGCPPPRCWGQRQCRWHTMYLRKRTETVSAPATKAKRIPT